MRPPRVPPAPRHPHACPHPPPQPANHRA
ncbi:MAG: hypothetical protein ACJA1R_003279, partial [Flavobacteriales bacterium]